MEQLEKLFGSEYVHTCAVYGRRRTGKSRLLREFCKGKRHVYLTALGINRDRTMGAFRTVLSEFPEIDPERIVDMRTFLEALTMLSSAEKTIIVIDEFPNLAEVCEDAPAMLQVFVDRELERRNLFLILCGSSISAMGEHLNDGDAPLFRRFVAQMRLEPLPYRDARMFHEGLSEEDRIRMYCIASGIPAYHQVMAGRTVEEAIEETILSPAGVLREETESIVAMELKPKRLYDSILGSIAGGRTDLKSIVESSGVDRTTCLKTLGNLELIGMVRRDTPYGKSRRFAYVISDGFVRFRYDVMSQGEMTLQIPDGHGLYQALRGYIQTFYGNRFEDVCRQYIASEYACRWIGRWWGSVPQRRDGVIVKDEDGRVVTEDVDVDIVAEVIDGEHIDLMLCECKFTNKLTGVREFRILEQRGDAIRKGDANKRYVMFSRSGFTPDLEDLARETPGIRLELVGMPELEAWAEEPHRYPPEKYPVGTRTPSLPDAFGIRHRAESHGTTVHTCTRTIRRE